MTNAALYTLYARQTLFNSRKLNATSLFLAVSRRLDRLRLMEPPGRLEKRIIEGSGKAIDCCSGTLLSSTSEMYVWVELTLTYERWQGDRTDDGARWRLIASLKSGDPRYSRKHVDPAPPEVQKFKLNGHHRFAAELEESALDGLSEPEAQARFWYHHDEIAESTDLDAVVEHLLRPNLAH